MSSGKITPELERFIHDHISSVEQLEVLLLLANTPEQEWSAITASQKLQRQPESVAARLEDLKNRGLLISRADQQLWYRFNSATRDADTIRSLDSAYAQRKDSVIETIFAAPSDKLRVFSDAFRLRRKD